MLRTGCLGNDGRHAKTDQIQRSQNGNIQLLTDAHYCHIAVLDPGFRKCLFVQRMNDIRILCMLPQLPHLFFFAVQHDQVCPGCCQLQCQRMSKPAKTNDAIGVFPITLLFKHSFLHPFF